MLRFIRGRGISGRRSIPVTYASAATHTSGLDIYYLAGPVNGTIGLGDRLNLVYPKTSVHEPWTVMYRGIVTKIRALSPTAVEFMVNDCDSDEKPMADYVLLQVPRSEARLGRWPIITFLRGRPWEIENIPNPHIPSRHRIHLEPAYEVYQDRFFPRRPDRNEIENLLKKVPRTVTVSVVDRKGKVHEVPLYQADGDVDVATLRGALGVGGSREGEDSEGETLRA
ncbi:hypothetical protein C8Q79DRAFT_38598 [Trametes meyenii]|nr:hypothetical protein C8Q79DRAFT_38598 [Trametes meyenii]